MAKPVSGDDSNESRDVYCYRRRRQVRRIGGDNEQSRGGYRDFVEGGHSTCRAATSTTCPVGTWANGSSSVRETWLFGPTGPGSERQPGPSQMNSWCRQTRVSGAPLANSRGPRLSRELCPGKQAVTDRGADPGWSDVLFCVPTQARPAAAVLTGLASGRSVLRPMGADEASMIGCCNHPVIRVGSRVSRTVNGTEGIEACQQAAHWTFPRLCRGRYETHVRAGADGKQPGASLCLSPDHRPSPCQVPPACFRICPRRGISGGFHDFIPHLSLGSWSGTRYPRRELMRWSGCAAACGCGPRNSGSAAATSGVRVLMAALSLTHDECVSQ